MGRVAVERARVMKACAHPVRTRILTALERGPATPRQLSDHLGEPLDSVSYHVRTLADLGSLELVDVRRIRGTVEHVYRRTERPALTDEQFARLHPEERRGHVGAILEDVIREMVSSLDTGGWTDRHNVKLHRWPLRLDEEAWEELAEWVERLSRRAEELEVESVERRRRNGEPDDDAIPARLILGLFEADA